MRTLSFTPTPQPIYEGLFDDIVGKMNPSNLFGSIINMFTPGKDSTPAQSEYEKARAKCIADFKKQREEEIKNELKHNDKMKALALQAEKAKELGEKKQIEALKEQERKRQEQIMQQKINELNKINSQITALGKTNGGPATEAQLKFYMNELARVSKEVPEDAATANNIMGKLNEMCYDEEGKFIEDHTAQLENLKKKYGDDYMEKDPFNSPEWQQHLTTFREDIDKKANEYAGLSDSEKKAAMDAAVKESLGKIARQQEELRSTDDVDADLGVLNKAQTAIAQHEANVKKAHDTVVSLQKEVDEKNKRMGKIDERLAEIQEFEDEYKKLGDDKEKKAQFAAEQVFGKDDPFETITDSDGKPSKKLKKEVISNLKKLGLSESDIESLETKAKGDDFDIKKEFVNTLQTEAGSTVLDNAMKQAEEKHTKAAAEQERLTNEKTAIEDQLKTDGDGDTLGKKLDAAVKNEEDEKSKTPDEILQNSGVDIAQVNKAMGKEWDTQMPSTNDLNAKVKGLQKERVDTERVDNIVNSAITSERAVLTGNKEKKQAAKYLDEHPDLKKDIDMNIRPQYPELKKEKGIEYMEIPDPENEDKKIKIYKPDPSSATPEDVERWDKAVAKQGMYIDAGEEPKYEGEPNGEAYEKYLKDHRQWEVNKQAHDSAVASLTDDERDELDDKELIKSFGKNGKDGEDVDNEGQDGEDVEVKLDKGEEDRLKELQGKSEDELKDDEKKQLKELQNKKKEGENPAKRWKRKRNKTTGKTTKRYYNDKGDSISAQDYKDLVTKYKSHKDTKENLQANKPLVFEKRAFTFTPISKVKK